MTLIALSQILDPPPAAAGQDPELGGIFALVGAAVMIAGGLLTFGRVGVSFTMEPRDPRRRVAAVDARGPADPVTDTHEPVAPQEGSAAATDAPGAAGAPAGADEPPPAEPGRGGRLFARSERKPEPPAEDAPAAVASETRATEPMAPEEGTSGPPPKQES